MQAALARPEPSIGFSIGRELARVGGEPWLETNDHRFFVPAFADAGHCSLRERPDLYARANTRFSPKEPTRRETLLNGFFEVDWKGQRFEVLEMSWYDGCYQTFRWISGPTREAAEDFFVAVCAWNAEVRSDLEVLVFEGGRWRKSAELHAAIQGSSFESLILPAELKRGISSDLESHFSSRELYEKYKVPWRRGVLFTGPPGNGKTHAIKALVNRLGRPCLYVKSFTSTCGEELANVRAVFERAREVAPCLLVFEDLDALVHDRNRSFFLNELDGFSDNAGVVTIATTNHPERLDPAIAERPSRFDRKYAFAMPGPTERCEYLEMWSRNVDAELRPSRGAIRTIGERTNGFSFAYLKELVVSSMMRWMHERREGSMDSILERETNALRAQLGPR